MPASVPGSPAPRSPALDALVEQVARVLARARAQQGDEAVRARVDAAIAPEDAAIAARVLRTLGSDLQDAPVDLGALDARLRAIADGSSRQEDAEGAPTDAPASRRPPPPTGLRSAMRPRRR